MKDRLGVDDEVDYPISRYVCFTFEWIVVMVRNFNSANCKS